MIEPIKIMAFNHCAIPIYIIILFTTFVRKTTKGAANQWFLTVVFVSLLTTIVDLFADGYEIFLPLSIQMKQAVSIANYIYFALRNVTPLLYIYFLLAVTRTSFQIQKKWKEVLMWIPYCVLFIVLATNPFHQLVFTVDCEHGYQRGPYLLFLYIISIAYSLVGVFYLIYCFRFLTFGKWFALMSMYLLSFIGIIIQYFKPFLLVEIFATSIALLLIILMVLRPEEITDINVGLPSWKAYQTELFKIHKMNHNVRINVLKYINASQVRDYLGEEKFNHYIQEIADIIEKYKRQHHIDMTTYYETPGTLYFILDGNSVNIDIIPQFDEISKTIRNATKGIEKGGLYLVPKMCTFIFPKEIKEIEDAINFGHTFSTLMPQEKNCIYATELIGTQKYELATNMTSILNRAIENQKFEMYYQPILSFTDNKFHSAEALIRLKDEIYGNISPAIFIPAAEKNGLILSIGDFVLENVFKFISEQDFSKLGLKYIEINLSVSQCLQLDLTDKILALQEKYNVSPSQVNFEITETTYGDVEQIKENIIELVQMGYSFSLDDYGTG